MKLKALIVFFLMGSMSLTAQKSYQLQSPDKKLQAVVTVGDDIRFSFTHDGTEVRISHLHDVAKRSCLRGQPQSLESAESRS